MGEQMDTELDIAVIGIAGRFPGAENTIELWHNLINSVESISFFTEDELRKDGTDNQTLEDPNYVPARGKLENSEYFDAHFFGYSPKEAGVMDPQVRVFHECTWTALEDAGYDPHTYQGLIGLFVGATTNFYWEALAILSGKSADLGFFATTHLTRKDFLSLRVSYKLNLKGPSYNIASTCSTSLVTVHLACQAILNGECEMALAGGITIASQKKQGYVYQEGMVLSPDGHCKAFDADAKGLVSGEGAGVVLLKRLEDAIREGDYIYAVVKGSATNNDGNRKVGFTAPSIEGQAEVVNMALNAAGVEAESISYIETHGTGTELGDPVEIAALKLAFNTNKKGFCAIGSAKTNVGHLDSAAGITGFIKTVLALKHRVIPPILHFNTPNPKLDIENSPFYVNATLKKWESTQYPLRAGVSALGIGGTNVHVILEEAPQINELGDRFKEPPHALEDKLILLSARTETALETMTQNLVTYLRENPGINLADAVYTLQVGRRAFAYRRFTVASTVEDAVQAFSPPTSRSVQTFLLKDEDHPVIFMFSGLGSQYVNMGRELYQNLPIFREEMDRCFEILKPLVDFDPREILYPGSVKNSDRIDQAAVSQPVLFSFEYALAKLLMGWGIKPHALIGYSLGEYTAACISGVISVADALKLIVARGNLVAAIQEGSMLSVPMESHELKPLLYPDVSLAIDNGPSCIVAGSNDIIRAFGKQMKEKGFLCMTLSNSRAIHSSMMEPILNEFAEIVSQFELKVPQIPYISNVTGHWITVEDAASPAYWVKHLRQTVQFSDGMKELSQITNAIFVEIGPGRDLNALVTRYIEKKPGSHALNLIRPPQKDISDVAYLLAKTGRLWLYGQTINWSVFYPGEKRTRIPLPTYPFERKPYIIDESKLQLDKDFFSGKKADSIRKDDVADWFYIPRWMRGDLLFPTDNKELKKSPVLVFSQNLPLVSRIVAQMKADGVDVTVVYRGSEFRKLSDNEFVIDDREISGYVDLLGELSNSQRLPGRIIHMWGLTKDLTLDPDDESFENLQYQGVYSILYLTRALVKQNTGSNVTLEIVTNHLYEVTGEETLMPEKSTILGPPRVIPQEYPFITCRVTDIVLPGAGSRQEKRVVEQLLNEFTTQTVEAVVAYRGNYRWLLSYSPIRLEKTVVDPPRLRKEGVYLITGGAGIFGLILARYLARNFKAKLVLTARSPLPAEDEWDQWLTSHPEDDVVSMKLRELLEIRKAGGEVMVRQADAADLTAMEQVFREAEDRFGLINGVIHAAGIVTGRTIKLPIEDVGVEECREQFTPKVKGLFVLAQILANRSPDFCLLTSSLSPILGGLGFFSYSAANSFMDAFVYKYNQDNDIKWMSVNWEGWRIEEEINDLSSAFGAEEHRLTLSPVEVGEALLRILNHYRTNQLIVTPGDLPTRIEKWVKLTSLRREKLPADETQDLLDMRPDLSGEYLAPRNDMERELTRIWQELMGYEQLGVRDDFFELGGDSLKAITLSSKIQKELNYTISIKDLFDNPTIEGITKCVFHSEKEHQSGILLSEAREYYSLSSNQRGFYIGEQLNVKGLTLNMAEIYIIKGKLDPENLEKTFNKLIQRHESLRTSFLVIEGEPVQRIHAEDDIEFAMEYHKVEEEELKEIRERFLRPFDLSKAPLLRVALVDLGENKCSLMLDMHHIITDAVSHEILLNDFLQVYKGEELPELKYQYKDFSQTQIMRLQSGELKEQEDFWLKQFQPKPPALNLPTDYPGSIEAAAQTTFIDFSLDETETQKVRVLAKKEEVTLFIFFMAIYNVLLSKLTGKQDIVVATITAGRTHVDLNHIIGAFVKPLPLRNYPTIGMSFQEFLSDVRNNTLRAFGNQDFCFDNFAEKLGVVGVIGSDKNNTMFEVGFSMQHLEDSSGKSGTGDDLEITHMSLMHTERELPFAINLEGLDAPNRFSFRLYYHPTLFAEETILKFSDYFKRVVASVIEEPHRKISGIDIKSTAERELIDAEIRKAKENITADFDL
jgi:acyl transferase domain-containing protein/acyl carrier protein